jgi:hypothetical protein
MKGNYAESTFTSILLEQALGRWSLAIALGGPG